MGSADTEAHLDDQDDPASPASLLSQMSEVISLREKVIQAELGLNTLALIDDSYPKRDREGNKS
jgi:hypothetical protein